MFLVFLAFFTTSRIKATGKWPKLIKHFYSYVYRIATMTYFRFLHSLLVFFVVSFMITKAIAEKEKRWLFLDISRRDVPSRTVV